MFLHKSRRSVKQP